MIADELIELHRSPCEVAPFSERYDGLSAAAGYQAARALHEHRVAQGWRPMGRKIGFTNRTLWARYGVHEPMWGTIYDRTVLFSHDDACAVPLAGLVQPRIEPEICFKLHAAPRVGRLIESIEWVAHAVEIVQCHHPRWKVTLADCTTDNGLHGRLVVGTPTPIADLPNLEANLPAVEVVLSKEGRQVDRGIGANVLDSPLLALGHLVEILARQPGAAPLEAGEIVTTGVLTDAHPVAPDESWETELHGVPLRGLRLTFR